MSLMLSLNHTEMRIISDLINNINGQISFDEGIPKTKVQPFQQRLC